MSDASLNISCSLKISCQFEDGWNFYLKMSWSAFKNNT